ncbi:DDE-type integrase/transposase/recombinase [Streptomyces pseudogriseolus]|uniref:DDE-type integrase/transposase/recombinase n=1 Tax=Streptomyces pseudogriseolus TaxID=36817 RepID=UPI003FA2B983
MACPGRVPPQRRGQRLGPCSPDRCAGRNHSGVSPRTHGMAFVRINGERKYLWRAVDQDATCWTSSCSTAGTKAAARRFFRRLRGPVRCRGWCGSNEDRSDAFMNGTLWGTLGASPAGSWLGRVLG